MASSRRLAALASLLLLALLAGCGGDEAATAAADTGTATLTQGLGASLSTTFTGAALGGAVPQGDARVEMFPPATLQLRVKNVNLPDGTLLSVSLAGYPVGSFALSKREGAASLPVGFQVGINSWLVIRGGGQTIAATTWH